jgi:hypothetical protein
VYQWFLIETSSYYHNGKSAIKFELSFPLTTLNYGKLIITYLPSTHKHSPRLFERTSLFRLWSTKHFYRNTVIVSNVTMSITWLWWTVLVWMINNTKHACIIFFNLYLFFFYFLYYYYYILSICTVNDTLFWKKRLNSDEHRFHQYQKKKQSHLIWAVWTQNRPRYITL